MWKYVKDPTITPVKAVREGNVKEWCATYKKLVSKYKNQSDYSRKKKTNQSLVVNSIVKS